MNLLIWIIVLLYILWYFWCIKWKNDLLRPFNETNSMKH